MAWEGMRCAVLDGEAAHAGVNSSKKERWPNNRRGQGKTEADLRMHDAKNGKGKRAIGITRGNVSNKRYALPGRSALCEGMGRVFRLPPEEEGSGKNDLLGEPRGWEQPGPDKRTAHHGTEKKGQ